MMNEERENGRGGAEEPSGGSPGRPPGLLDFVNNYLLLIYAGACFLMYASVTAFFQLRGLLYLSLILPGIVSIVLPLMMISRRSALGFAREFMLDSLGPKTALVTLVAAGASILPIEAFSGLFERAWPPSADYISIILSIKPKGPASFAATAFGLAVAVPFAEELLFRGFVQRIFARNMSPAIAIALSGAIFGIVHAQLSIIPGVIALGVLFGYLLHATRRLWCPILAHGAFNLVSLIRLQNATEEEIVSAQVTLPDLRWMLLSLVVCAAALWILARMHRASRGGA